MRKRFLFLQGHPTFFCVRLGDALRAAGHDVLKVRLSGQDWLFWPRVGGVSYGGRLGNWGPWVEALMRREGITDVIYYADRHPYHVQALAAARRAGARAWALEFGYLRPDWLTLEPEAMGAFSRFPKDAEALARLARPAPDLEKRGGYGHPFLEEALFDIARYVALTVGRLRYPFYVSDAPFGMVQDYYYWIRTLLSTSAAEKRAEAVQDWCLAGGDYTLLAMQLNHDYQIRASTHYGHLEEMMDEIFASMMRAAPETRKLVIKLHPLDNGMQDWPRRVAALAARHGAKGRYELIQGGDLGLLIREAKGVVLANSTVGLHALRVGVPVKTMGAAVYDMPGLTHQGPLDAFWTRPEPVDPKLERDLVHAMANEIQIRGSFYDREGQKAAIAEIVERLTTRPYPDWA